MGLFQVGDERHERSVKLRNGDEVKVWLRELSAKDEDDKLQRMVSFNMKGDAGTVKTDIGKSRRFEIFKSVVDWEFTTDDQPLAPDGSNKLPINEQTIINLPNSIYQQLRRMIAELNGLPTDEEAEVDVETGDEKEAVEHPTTVP